MMAPKTSPLSALVAGPRRRPAPGFWKSLGPGLITGASDDDPSGIATYSQAGAAFGLATLWTALFTFPLMAAMQEMCARIGLVTAQGLAGNLRQYYPRAVLFGLLTLTFPAIVLNIGADLEGMGAVAHLLVPRVPSFLFSVLFTGLLLMALVRWPYRRIAAVLKWLCAALLVYVVVPFLVRQNWADVLRHAVVPELKFTPAFVGILVALLGTTISPYLFFWQADMEAEEMHHHRMVVVDKILMHRMQTDMNVGMLSSNAIMFFIMLITATVLFPAGLHDITTVEQAALALRPLAGEQAYLLFAVGIIGTGLLAIPVLAGALSYAVAEALHWRSGLDRKLRQAPGFYITIFVALVAGVLLDVLSISPMQALLYAAMLYGLTAPVMIAIVLHLANNKAVMGEFTNGLVSNVLGGATLVLMSAAGLLLLYFQLVP